MVFSINSLLKAIHLPLHLQTLFLVSVKKTIEYVLAVIKRVYAFDKMLVGNII